MQVRGSTCPWLTCMDSTTKRAKGKEPDSPKIGHHRALVVAMAKLNKWLEYYKRELGTVP